MTQVPLPHPPATDDWKARIQWRRFTFKDAFAQGWQTFKAAYWFALVATIVGFGALFLGNVINQLVQSVAISIASGRGRAGGALVPFMAITTISASLLTMVFLQWPIYASMLYAAVSTARRERISTRTILRGYHRLGRAVFAFFLIVIAVIIMMVPLILLIAIPIMANKGGGPPFGVFAIGILTILYFAAMGFVLWRLVMGAMLAMDEEVRSLTVIECFKHGWSMTRPFAWPFFGLMLSLYAMNILGAFVLCFPLFFFTAPLTLCVLGAAYHQLTFSEGLFKSPFVCHACGYPVDPGMVTCPECGAPTAAPATWTSAESPESQIPPTLPPPMA